MTDDERLCRERLEELTEENAQLRRSAETFGRLAERLSKALHEERRKLGDRRGVPRPDPDRRRSRA
jgi:hypothetical protein